MVTVGFVFGVTGFSGAPYTAEYGVTATVDALVSSFFDPAKTGVLDGIVSSFFDPAQTATLDGLASLPINPAITTTIDAIVAAALGPTATIDGLIAEFFDFGARNYNSGYGFGMMGFSDSPDSILDLSEGVAQIGGIVSSFFDPAQTATLDGLASQPFDPATTAAIDALVAAALGVTAELDALVSDIQVVTSSIDALIAKEPFLHIGDNDLLGLAVIERGPGGGPNIKQVRFSGEDSVFNYNDGEDTTFVRLLLTWTPQDGGREAALPTIYDIAENGPGGRFFDRTSLFFYEIDKVKLIPDITDPRATWFQQVVELYLKTNRMYCNFSYPFDTGGVAATLPQTSSELDNQAGHYGMKPDTLELTTYHDGSYQVEDLVYSMSNGDQMTITDKGLDGEVFTLTRDKPSDTLIAEIEDLIESVTKWSRNFTGDGSFVTDHIHLGNSESAYCDLAGPYPTRRNVLMQIKMAFSGDPIIEVSLDGGSTYETAVNASDMVSSSSTEYSYNLAETKNESNIRVRFTCDSNDTLDIYYIKFTRYLDISSADVPEVAAGATGTATISCNTGKSKSVMIDAEYRLALRGV